MPLTSTAPVKSALPPSKPKNFETKKINSGIKEMVYFKTDSNSTESVSGGSHEKQKPQLFHSANLGDTGKESSSGYNPDLAIPTMESNTSLKMEEAKSNVAVKSSGIFEKYRDNAKLVIRKGISEIDASKYINANANECGYIETQDKDGKPYFLKKIEEKPYISNIFYLPPEIPDGPSGKDAQVKYKDKNFIACVRTKKAIKEGTPLVGTSDNLIKIIQENNFPFLPNYRVTPDLRMAQTGGLDLIEFSNQYLSLHNISFEFKLKHFEKIANAIKVFNKKYGGLGDIKPENIVVEEDENGELIMSLIDLSPDVITSNNLPEISGDPDYSSIILSTVLYPSLYHTSSVLTKTGITLNHKARYSKQGKLHAFIMAYEYTDIDEYNKLPDEFNLKQLLGVLRRPEAPQEFIDYFHKKEIKKLAALKGITLYDESWTKSDLMPFIKEYKYFNPVEFDNAFAKFDEFDEFGWGDFIDTLGMPPYDDLARITNSHITGNDEYPLAAAIMRLTGGLKVYEPKQNLLGVSISGHVEAWVEQMVKEEYQKQFKLLIENPLYYIYCYGPDRVHVAEMLNFEAAKLKNF